MFNLHKKIRFTLFRKEKSQDFHGKKHGFQGHNKSQEVIKTK